MAPATAQAALEALWLAMVELAEISNDRVVASHQRPSLKHARELVRACDDLAALAHAAAVLARHAGAAP
jgi:hypothetical protein